MQDDIRATAAQYYDANPTIPDDLAFYTARLPSADAVVLELGCGTGRVLLPLAAACGSIYGLEQSPAMLARCLQKLEATGLPLTKARAALGDITHFALGRRFDLIIAPYRVFQLLDTEAQVEGLFRCVRAHLTPGETGILNVFHPRGGFERRRQEWERVPEVRVWETTVDGVRLRCNERRARFDPTTQTPLPGADLLPRRGGHVDRGRGAEDPQTVLHARSLRGGDPRAWLPDRPVLGGVCRGALWRRP